MIPKLHPKGSSFAGAAAYLLHDKDKASTSERVAWTETRNLATDDAHVAWRVMAATAMDQERLKEDAGVPNTGRKSDKHVLHFSLSWHEDEAGTLTTDEMKRAAQGALEALGAEDRQAIIVAHDDEPHPHVHILLNRVSAEDGKMLSSSKEKLRLSEWAQNYEQDRGYILCEQRVINNAARARGEFTRGAPEIPRARNAAKDNQDPKRTARLADLLRRGREQAERHASAIRELEAAHKARLSEIKESARRGATMQRDAVREEFRPRWEYRYHEHNAERGAFRRDEETFQGRMRNRAKSIDFKGIFTAGGRKNAITESFCALGSEGARLEALKRKQETENRGLASEQRSAEDLAARSVRLERDRLRQDNRERFLSERSSLILTQDMERAALRADWRELGSQRDQEQRRPEATKRKDRSFDTRADRGVKGRTETDSGGQAHAPNSEDTDKTPDAREDFKEAAADQGEYDPTDEEQRAARIREFNALRAQERDASKNDPDRGKGRDVDE